MRCRAVALSGCAQAHAEATDSPGNDDLAVVEAKGLTDQAVILEDGKVTATEYLSAVSMTIDCYAAAGVEVRGPWLNPVDNLTYIFDFPAGPPVQKAPGCDSKFLSNVQPRYLELTEAHMATDLQGFVVGCLSGLGYPSVADAGNAVTMYEELGNDSAQGIGQCISDGLLKLYPEQGVYFITW